MSILLLAVLWVIFQKTLWGVKLRAATEDRDMVAALGVDQKWLFSGVFVLGAALAGLAGGLQMPRQPAHLGMDLDIVIQAFAVIVIGGMGSIVGTFVSSLLVGLISALGAVLFSELSIVLVFVLMAVVLIIRPNGLLGKHLGPDWKDPSAEVSPPRRANRPIRLAWTGVLVVFALLPLVAGKFVLSTVSETLIYALFAFSFYFMGGPAGLISFGQAAFFAVGMYSAAMLMRDLGLGFGWALLAGPLCAAIAAALFGFFYVRVSGIRLAMLSLAFGQLVWAMLYQWYSVTNGDNGILNVWPPAWAADERVYYYITLVLCCGGILLMRHFIFAPFGYALRAGRDSLLRAEAVGIDIRTLRWLGFIVSGTVRRSGRRPDGLSERQRLPGLCRHRGVLRCARHGAPGWPQRNRRPAVRLGHLSHDEDLPADRVHALAHHHGRDPGAAGNVPAPRAGRCDHLPAGLVDTPAGLAGEGRSGPDFLPARLRDAVAGEPLMSLHPTQQGLLAVEGLRKQFGGNLAVDGVSFDLHAGELLALIGPNGAGKTTCFNMLNGQLKPTAGKVRLEGRDITGLSPAAIWREGVGRTFQITQTYGSMTVLENVQLTLMSRYRRTRSFFANVETLFADEALALLKRVGMAEQAGRGCGVLAYGDLKRVELAVAMASEPRVLLMDEPTAGMAPKERVALMQLTAEIVKERGVAVLFTEHDMDVVFRHASKVLVLNRGRVIASGVPEAVRDDPQVREVYLGSGSMYGKH